jgi:hypothetical protein
LERLDVLIAKLESVTKEKERDVSILKKDLESEQEARRGWQDKALASRERLLAIVKLPPNRILNSLLTIIGSSTVCACINRCGCRYIPCEITFLFVFDFN